MMYSKGDTLEFQGVVTVVLKDRLTGVEFYNEYLGQEILLIAPDLTCYPRKIYETDEYTLKTREWVWYYILIGDEKAWHGYPLEGPTPPDLR